MTVIAILFLLFLIVLSIVLMLAPTGPSVCPNCKKEYIKAEPWSYAEYAWGLRCPHCKHEFDITP